MLKTFELVQHPGPIEEPNIPRLDRRQAAHRPTEVHEVRLDRVR